MNLDNYFTRTKKELSEEYNFFKKWRDNWDWYNVLGSLFGFDYFISPNPMAKRDKENFTKSLGKIITSNFDVAYNSLGMILTPKKNLETAVVYA